MAVGAFKILGQHAPKNLPKQKNLKKRPSEVYKCVLATQIPKRAQRPSIGPHIASAAAYGGGGGGQCRNSRNNWRVGNQSARKTELENARFGDGIWGVARYRFLRHRKSEKFNHLSYIALRRCQVSYITLRRYNILFGVIVCTKITKNGLFPSAVFELLGGDFEGPFGVHLQAGFRGGFEIREASVKSRLSWRPKIPQNKKPQKTALRVRQKPFGYQAHKKA